MSAPLLSDLREPPVRGRFYMVPVVSYTYFDRSDLWPVLGPKHHDRGAVGFPHIHYHLDPRFVSAVQARYLRSRAYGNSVEQTAAIYPLARTDMPPPERAHLVRLRCRVGTWEYQPPRLRPRWLDAFDQEYGEVAKPIQLRDGRMLCPHRKVDLSSLAADADGIVTCPLHGLRVCVRQQVPA